MSEAKSSQALWYVVHTYSGYENKVKANLEKTVENRGMQDIIQEVQVPMEEILEVRNDKRHVRQQKVFPGYVMVKMVMTDESWYVVRNTRGVTGFVGPGSKPVPLTEAEVATMMQERAPIDVELHLGDRVKVLGGALEDFEGVIDELYPERERCRVIVSMFGRDTPVELGFLEVQKI